MNAILKAAKEAKAKLNSADKRLRTALNAVDAQSKKVSDFYSDRISNLRLKKDTSLSKLNERRNKLYEKAKKEMEGANEPLERLARIVRLIGVSKDNKDLELFKPGKKGVEVPTIITATKDKYMQTAVFICSNRKPKNKYSLIIVGRSVFGKDLIKYPYTYGNNASTYFWGADLNVTIKEAATKEELIAFYNEKGKNKTFWNKEEHDKLVEDYNWVLENCKTKEWEMQYLLERKDYYENSVSCGTSKPEYKKVIQKIKKLRGK